MVGIFVLTTAITIQSSRLPAGEAVDAYRALAKATYLQTESDQIVKNLEKKYTPKYVKEYGPWIAGITKVAIEKQFSVEWTF